MRLSRYEIEEIKQAVRHIDPRARIYLFGSRADDGKRGGDIDLLIMSRNIDDRGKSKILWTLYEKLGEQKIDLVVAEQADTPFVQLALRQGIEL